MRYRIRAVGRGDAQSEQTRARHRATSLRYHRVSAAEISLVPTRPTFDPDHYVITSISSKARHTHDAVGQQVYQHFHCARDDYITKGMFPLGWLGSRVVSVLDSVAEEPGFKSQSRRCRVTVLGKLFTPTVPLFTKQQNW